jgi:hypothetical protein
MVMWVVSHGAMLAVLLEVKVRVLNCESVRTRLCQLIAAPRGRAPNFFASSSKSLKEVHGYYCTPSYTITRTSRKLWAGDVLCCLTTPSTTAPSAVACRGAVRAEKGSGGRSFSQMTPARSKLVVLAVLLCMGAAHGSCDGESRRCKR